MLDAVVGKITSCSTLTALSSPCGIDTAGANLGGGIRPSQGRLFVPSPTPQKPSLSSVVLQARRPIAVDDVCCSSYIDPDLPAIFQNRSMLGIPLLVNERKLGAILISYDQVHHCTPEEIALGEQVPVRSRTRAGAGSAPGARAAAYSRTCPRQ